MNDPIKMIGDYIDDSISDVETAELERWLMEDPAHAEIFARQLQLHSQLRDALAGEVSLRIEQMWEPALFNPIEGTPLLPKDEPGRSLDDAIIMQAFPDTPDEAMNDAILSPPSATMPEPARLRFSRPYWKAAAASAQRAVRKPRRLAAALVLLSIGLFLLINRRSGPTLAGEIAATWDQSRGMPKVGSALPSSEIQLTSGLARIQFATGAQIILEAPATVKADATNGITLLSGKLTGVMPAAAHGFTVATPGATLVDLGTEFGVIVRDDGPADFQVFKGTVSLSPRSTGAAAAGGAAMITAGSGRRIATDGTTSELTFNPSQYVRAEDFDRLHAAPVPASYARWLSYSQGLPGDPDLVAYYKFERVPETPNQLLNHSSAGSSLDGILGGGDPASRPQWSMGRWPEKSALTFLPGTSQHIALPDNPALDFSRVGQDSCPFTLCAWIKPDVPVAASGGIICRGSRLHEQYAIDFPPTGGPLRTWVRDQAAPLKIAPAVSAELQNLVAWHFVASVFDPGARVLRLFVDGKFINETRATRRVLSVSGPVYIGSRKDKSDLLDTTFTGSIDEIAIFKKSLSADAIWEMYLAGKPD